jgi:UDP-GlcNAc3NAcA epimerase
VSVTTRRGPLTVLTVVGARPQFVKAAAVSRCLRVRHREVLVHTGQHYDEEMSDVFFRELELPHPDEHLGVGSGTHAEQTAKMLIGIEAVMTRVRPDLALVYGDTNSTLAGALAAAKLAVPIAHVEAGMRSFNRRMPEEINRVLTDKMSSLLFCSSESAAGNLRAEGITAGVHMVGDVMADVLRTAMSNGHWQSSIAGTLGLEARRYVLATIHRAANTDDPNRLESLIAALGRTPDAVVLPLHPRTRKSLAAGGIETPSNVRMIDPVGYGDMTALIASARVVVTDSGGVQKEAYWLAVPCVTLRDETEWIETVETGWNQLVSADADRVADAIAGAGRPSPHPALYGDGRAAERIVGVIDEQPR